MRITDISQICRCEIVDCLNTHATDRLNNLMQALKTKQIPGMC